LPVALCVAIALASAVPVSADDAVEVYPQSTAASADSWSGADETATSWFVELAEPSTSDGGSAAAVAASHDAFKSSARAKGVKYSQRFAYGDLWNGFAVDASGGDVAALRALPEVKSIWPVVTATLPAGESGGGETLDLATALALTGANYVQDTLGFTGKNVRVGVMDSGVDYDNPDLGGCFGPSCRVVAGWDFVGDTYDADPASPDYQPVPHPDADPDDCGGHGTHVAGIVGANGEVKGVAPDVRLGAYRVFGCAGSTSTDVMLAAMERALADKMDVLNISIGAAFQWPTYPTAVGADRLVTKHGMVVVASIGNSGTTGLYAAGAPGVGANVIGVASFDNTTLSSLTFDVTTSGRQVPYQGLTTTPAPPTDGTSAPIVHLGRGCQQDLTVTPPITMTDTYLADPAGKVALIERGTCTFNNKYQRAAAAGAVGVIIYAAAGMPELFVGGSVTGVPDVFGISVARADGLHLAAQTEPMASWTDVRVRVPVLTGNLISSFSSYGLAADLTLKPDLAAPGGNIFSTVPLEQGGHGNNSGTSMAAPYVSGAAALLIESRSKNLRELGPARIRAALQNTAVPHLWWGNPALGLLDNVHRQGAGMLNIRGAVEAQAEITPSKLSLGESQAGPSTRALAVRSLPGAGGKTVTYWLSHEPALATGMNTFTPSFNTASATLAFSAPSVSVKNNQTATVDVTITPPMSPSRGVYGGYIKLAGDDGSTYRVPYAGFIGDYQAIPVLTATGCGFPFVARAGGSVSCGMSGTLSGVTKQAAGATFTLAGADQPIVAFHADHQSRRLSIDAVSTAGTAYRLIDFDYFGRNTAATSFFGLQWNGEDATGTAVPDGTYTFRITALKALGDPANPAHTETASTLRVVIDRP
jgi:subtilisin family serine protease